MKRVALSALLAVCLAQPAVHAVAQTVSDDAHYVDPLMSGRGVDGISAMIAGAVMSFAASRRPRS